MSAKKQNRGKKPSGGAVSSVTSAAMSIAPHQLKVGESTGTGPQLKTQVAVQQSYHKGPIPSPKTLAEYEEIKPGLADRIVRMAEQEGDHSRLVELRALNWSIAGQLTGQIFGAGLAIACLFFSYKLAMAGHDGVAAILGGTTLTTVVLAFLRSRKEPQKE